MGIFDYFQKKEPVQETVTSNLSEQKHYENTVKRANNEYLDSLDLYLVEAGRLVIEKEKASIGMLQRAFRIGFNQAARIMDMLEEMGVVGEEEATKPRRILVNAEEYERIVENYTPKETILKTESSNHQEQKIYTIEDVENILKSEFGIDADFSNDGESLKGLKNIIVPSTGNEKQIEVINMLLKHNSPLAMRMILMDDSIINYSSYNGVPQLLIPVVSEKKKIDVAVQWCSDEMEQRINKFVENRVKNIDSYNRKMIGTGELLLPKIVCIVNESNSFFEAVTMPLERMFLNCNMVGIYFILFSRFSIKSLSMGILGELLEVSTADKLKILLSQDVNSDSKRRITRNFDDMDGHQFEKFCADILRKNGFEYVEVTQGSGDHGIDILAEKDDITYAIQCKCYSADIGNAAVQQAHTGKSIYKRDIAVVLTNRYFTLQAIEEAQALGVKLWDRDKLNSLIENS